MPEQKLNTDIFKIDNGLSNNENVPFYFQIVTLIKRQIKAGVLKSGDMLPSESQFCKMYGVSRTTVRQALDRLEEEKLIIRRRGQGTFIADEKLHRNLNHLYSFTDDMKAMNLVPYSKIIQSSVIEATDELAEAFNIPVKSGVYELVRVRYAGEEPLLVERTNIPLYLCPGINKEDFSNNSLYEILRSKYDLSMNNAVETYEAVKLSKEEAKLLKCPSSSPAFHVRRISYLENGMTFELTNSTVRSDKCIFRVELKADKSQIHFSREINP